MGIQTALTSSAGSWPLLLVSILALDTIVLFLTRYFPGWLGLPLNTWYTKFGLLAVISDVTIIAIGFALARWVYNTWFSGQGLWVFLGLLVAIQAVHDILFYLGVILPLPHGVNAMMDVFKEYAASAGGKIIAGDAVLMLGSAAIFLGLERLPASGQWFAGLLTAYALPYILYTRVGG